MLEPARPVHAFEVGGVPYVAGTKAGAPSHVRIYRLDPASDGFTPVAVADLTTSAAGMVSAVGQLGGQILIARSGQLDGATDVYPVAIAGATATAGTPVRLTGSFTWGPGDPPAYGAYFAGGGIYLTSCHANGPARIEYAALSFSGSTLVAQPQVTVVDAPASKIIACNTTPNGLIWIEQLAGLYRVWSHVPGSAAAVVATIPGSLPGVGDVFTHSADDLLPGVTDVAALPGGDVLVLLSEHDQAGAQGLHLARWHAGDGSWSSVYEVEAAATWQRGELCTGPFTETLSCPDLGRDTCGPAACAIRPPEPRVTPTAHIGEAYLVVRGSTVSIVYEGIETQRKPLGAIGGSDVFHVRVPLPP
jgi:hypothetical protein